jgi:hypothetical protein
MDMSPKDVRLIHRIEAGPDPNVTVPQLNRYGAGANWFRERLRRRRPRLLSAEAQACGLLAYSQAHSPLRNTGVRAPFASRPSMSILSDPIIQSMWIMLLLPPCSAICSGLSFAPSTKHFV